MINKQKLARVFDEITKEAQLDYALTNGVCCNTCTLEELTTDFGENSRGIWIKWFPEGMNKSSWRSQQQLFISHDLTKEQEKITLEILRKYYAVEYNGDNYTCIIIKNKEEV